MNKIIGIDLGTTNSCVAVMEGGDPVVIPNSEGTRTTPSVVSFDKSNNGKRLVGVQAKRLAISNPDTIFSAKRFMGKKYDSIKESANQVPYKVKKGRSGNAVIQIGTKAYTPQEISAMILQKMKATANEYLGKEVKKAVITVPAYFNDSERHATKEAGEIAGLEVVRIINEPTAAAIAYGFGKKEKEKIAVYDLGGGTFDITILDCEDGVFEVKATNGDASLGGDNFDERLIDHLVNEFKKEHGIDLKKDVAAHQRLKEAAEKAKVELSSSSQTEVNLPYITADSSGPKHLVMKVTRSKFEQLTDDLVQKTLTPCKKAIKDSGFKVSEIDKVILVGGSTRIPKVQEAVKNLFKKDPSKNVNPDEVVACGAAIQGGILAGDVKDVILLDVTPLSLGIETKGGVFTKLIELNTTIPTKKSEIFSTAEDNQTTVVIKVYQGERPLAKDNRLIGQFHLDGIKDAPRGRPQIEVSFDVDANGIIQVSAKDKETNKEQNVRIEASSNLSEEEVDKMKKEAELHAEEDKKEREKIEIVNKADSLIFQMEKQLAEHKDIIPAELKEKAESNLNKLKKARDEKQVENIEELVKEYQEIMTAMQQEIQKAAKESKQEANADSKKEPVEDASFEEVKEDKK